MGTAGGRASPERAAGDGSEQAPVGAHSELWSYDIVDLPGIAVTDGAGPGADPVPLHRRSIEYEAFDAGDTLVVVGKLSDSRPWAEAGAWPRSTTWSSGSRSGSTT